MSSTLTPAVGIIGPIRVFTGTREQNDALIGQRPSVSSPPNHPTPTVEGTDGSDLILVYNAHHVVFGNGGDDVLVSE